MIQLPQDPIFIVGYPRSGTTLLQWLLVTQPGLYSFPETHYFCVVEKHMQIDDNNNIDPSCLDTVFEKIYEKMNFRFTAEEINSIYQKIEERKFTSKVLFEIIVTRFLLKQGVNIMDSSCFRWIEKTPTHANFLERIVEFYPRGRILHILRHPVPAIFSRKLKFPFNRETPVDELARHWNALNQKVEHFKETFIGYVHTLKYEDLVLDLEKELQTISDFLNYFLDFALISNVEKEKREQLSETFILPSETWKLEDRNQLITNTNDYYKSVIPRAEAETIEKIVKQNMEQYGYRPYFN